MPESVTEYNCQTKKPNTLNKHIWFLKQPLLLKIIISYISSNITSNHLNYDALLCFLGLTKVKFKKCSSESSSTSNQRSGSSGASVPVKVER